MQEVRKRPALTPEARWTRTFAGKASVDDSYFVSLLIVGGACIGFALHATSLAVQSRQRRYVYLTLLALLEAGYCLLGWRFLSISDSALARPWGHWLCTFTPYITFLFGELVIDLAERKPRWLVLFQRANLLLTTLFAAGVISDIVRGTSLMVEPEIRTDLASLHRHQIVFTPLGQSYLAWVACAFACFALALFRGYLARRDLLPMVVGCVLYFAATLKDFGVVVGIFPDGIFLQHFGFFSVVVGSWRVISNRFEDALAEMHASIQRLEEQRARLKATTTTPSQNLASLGTLAAGVAHEINNPIHGIMNYSLLLKRQLDPNTKAYGFADEIVHESNRVTDIVRSLLRFGRTDDTVAVAANMKEILERTLTLVRSSLVQDGIVLRVTVADELPEMTCRTAHLQQAILNLITNARDALRSRAQARDDERAITIEVSQRHRKDEPWIVLTVTDTGDGFDPALSERIFDPFFTTKGPDGIGLGLSVSHGIVQSHGGQMTCESTPGVGARFCIEVPCTPPFGGSAQESSARGWSSRATES